MPILNGYATRDEVKAELRLTTTTDDQRIDRCIEAASRHIEDLAHGQKFHPHSGSRVFGPWGQAVFIGYCRSITQVEESSDETTWTVVDPTAYRANAGDVKRRINTASGRNWLDYVRVTGDWEPETIPAGIRQATIIEAVRLFKRPDTPEGVLVGDFGAARMAREDPDVLKLIRPHAIKVLG